MILAGLVLMTLLVALGLRLCMLFNERDNLERRVHQLEDMLGHGDERVRREVAATLRERARSMAKTYDYLQSVEDFIERANRIEKGKAS